MYKNYNMKNITLTDGVGLMNAQYEDEESFTVAAAEYTKRSKSVYIAWTSNCSSFKIVDHKGNTYYTTDKNITIDVGGGFKGAAFSIWGVCI